MIPLEEAQQRLLCLARPLGAETMAVDDAAGRYLMRSLASRRMQPAADLSAMDGFAVAGAGPWRIVGESRAGAPFAGSLAGREAARISTGAACPAGTDAIVLLEDGIVESETLRAPQPEQGRWIRRAGFDFTAGTTLIEAGTRLGPAHIALARASGHALVEVGRLPRIAIIELGDELVSDPENCPPHLLPASNGAMVAALARGAGARARQIGPLADNRAELALALDEVPEAEVIVTTAGASLGEHDHVRGALDDTGWTVAFWRVAIRPGKPLLVATRGHQLLLGLPGNPSSSFVTAFLFLLPLLRAMQGARHPAATTIPLPLAEPLPAGEGRREFRRARLVDGTAMPLPERDSSALATLAAADLLIDRPIGAPEAPAGTIVPCYWLESGGVA